MATTKKCVCVCVCVFVRVCVRAFGCVSACEGEGNLHLVVVGGTNCSAGGGGDSPHTPQ